MKKLTAAVMIAACSFFGLPAVSTAIEVAGTLYVDVDASTFNTGDAIWANAGTYDDFSSVGTPARISIEQTPAVYFDGVADVFVGTEFAPEGLVGLNPTRSMEAWVLNPTISGEETIVSWGRRGGPDGTNMAFNYGNDGKFGAVGHWGGDFHDVGWINNDWTVGAPDANKWHHLVYTFDGEVTRLYSDGELWNEEETVATWGDLNTWGDTPIAIASQWEIDTTTLTAGLRGSMALGKLRIHDGVLTEDQILANFNAEKPLFNDPQVGPPTPAPIPNGPIHRYSFSNAAAGEAEGAVLIDSVGGANGEVIGSGASLTGSGLSLPGGTSDIAPYGDLPNGLISGLIDTTIETWMTVDGPQVWGRVFDFGSSEPGGEDGEIDGLGDTNGGGVAGLDYLALTTSRDADTNVARLEMRNEDPAGGGVTTVDITGVGATPSEEAHLVVVYDSDGGSFTGNPVLRVYQDGKLLSEGETSIELADIRDVNNWLGRSNWTGDSNVEGTYNEFRIYDYALSANQVLGNFEAGADTVNIDAGPGCDFNADTNCDNQDIDLLAGAIRGGTNPGEFDLNADGLVSDADRDVWVKDLKNTYFGDVNLDGEFNSGDLVAAFQIGEYEDGVAANSGWADGDWSGDAEFTSGDFVLAFQDGGFENGPRAGVSAVPEPASLTLLVSSLLGMLVWRRRR